MNKMAKREGQGKQNDRGRGRTDKQNGEEGVGEGEQNDSGRGRTDKQNGEGAR